jgi:hypothetical protein
MGSTMLLQAKQRSQARVSAAYKDILSITGAFVK